MPATVSVDPVTVAGRHGPIPARWYRPANPSAPAMLWLPGGAFFAGNLDLPESDAAARAIAAHGVAVLAIAYRKVTPWPPAGARYPLPLDDVTDAFRRICENHDEVWLGGASAGACLAASATQRQLDQAAPVPRGLALAYGTFHARLPPASVRLRRRIAGLHAAGQFTAPMVALMNRNYAGADLTAFPGGRIAQPFPDTLLLDADRDRIRASGDCFAAELRAAGTRVRYRVQPGARHGFLNRPSTAEFTAGIATIARWVLDRG